MYGFLKCYYGYKNRGDELLFFGVLDRIQRNTHVRHITIEVGDKTWMTQRCTKHQDIIENIGVTYDLVDISDSYVLPEDCLYFFGGGEVVNDQDKYILPPKPSLKHKIFSLLSRFFTRSGRNYYLSYRKTIHKGQFFLLGGIGKPYKYTTKILYKQLLSRAKKIISRDATSHYIALQYNKNALLYNDFSEYAIHHFRQKKSIKNPLFDPNSYILINAQSHAWSEDTLKKITTFVQSYPDKIPVYFPCDYADDMQYFSVLQEKIVGLQLYDRTHYSVDETLALFAHAADGIGSRLHFLYPLHSFGKPYTTTTTKDKVAKLLSPLSIDAI